MRTLPSAIALAALLAPLPPAAAQNPAQVLKQFKQQTGATVKSFKSGLAAIADELDAKIKQFELAFEALADDDAPVEDFVAALAQYQLEAAALELDTDIGLDTEATAALGQLTPGGGDESVYPKGLVLNDGGTLDDAIAAVRQAAAKANASVVKKLAKLTAKLRKATDMRLAVTLRPVEPTIIAPSGADVGGQEHVLAIDLVVSFNRGGADDDGRLWMGGTADAGLGSVNWIFNGAGFASGTATSDGSTARWLAATDPLSALQPEGNYLAIAHQSSGSTTIEHVGMR